MKINLTESLELEALRLDFVPSCKPAFQFAPTAVRRWTRLKFMWIIAIVSLLLLTVSAQANNWYVDSAATGSNNGTSWVNAWTSLTAVSGVSAGDTVYISGGINGQTYTGQFPHIGGGVKGNPITFKAGQDAGHNGVVTFDGSGSGNQWIFAAPSQPISWITVDGNFQGSCHIIVQNWNGVLMGDNGATGLVLRYIKASSGQWRAYGCDYLEYDHCVIGPQMAIDRNIVGLGSGAADYTRNSIHDCTIYAYYQHDTNSIGGNGDDFIANIESTTVKHNNFIGVYVTNYTYNQHQDGIQAGGGYCWIDSNYFENVANYAVYGDMIGGGQNWVVINNVINYPDPALSSQPTQAISIGSNTTSGNMANIIIANNTIYRGNNAISLGQGNSGNSLSACAIVNNLCVNQTGQPINALTGQGSNLIMLCNKPVSGCIPPDTQNPVNNSPPTFVNPNASYPNANFQLAASDTGAMANGTTWPSAYFNYDAAGNSRNGAWSLGAYQYGGTIPAIPASNTPASPGNLRIVSGS